MGKNQHVVPRNGQWAVLGAGNSKVTRVCATQREAVSLARKIARKQGTDLVIHRSDGRIRDKNSYGSDPLPPKG
jgi:adenine/guanine phosphoribosyltransferase-like PRPP-binding protein